MMFYIIDALSKGEGITQNTLKICLQYATGVIIVFAVIFLFYTNSFLIKRRKKEIGVYNILGMGKRHIARMMAVETILTAGISILGGLVFGIIFGKLMYLLLLKILHNSVDMQFSVNGTAIVQTVILFAGIFLLTYLYNILQIQLVNPVELLHGGNQGEKEPKSRWLLVIVGVAALGNGYWIALTTEAPLEVLLKFFIAVICVIIGTYALFIAGSIVVLKMLRKNKAYYYNPKHFTSVSGMIYRMKQNGAGLANICVVRDYLKIRPDWAMIRRILGIGIPSGVENSMFQLGKLAIQSTVSTLGTTAIAAQAMTNILENLNGMAAIGIGVGLMTIVGQCMGADRKDEAVYYIKKLSVIAEVAIIVSCLLVFALTGPVTVLGGMEPASAKMCFHMVIWITIVKPIVWTLAFVPAYGLRAAGDVKFSMITSCLVMWLCRFCLCVILIRFLGFGPMGVWIGMFADWTVRAVIFTWRFHSRRWLRYKVI